MATKVTAYDDTAIAQHISKLPGWKHEEGAIRRVYETDGWPTTLMLANAIGYCAEAADHHPDLEVSYRRLAVALSTHSAGGITDKDFALARRIEDIARWHPAVHPQP